MRRRRSRRRAPRGGVDPREYIQLIERRNRLMKKLQEASITDRERELKAREEQFNVFVGGANKPAKKPRPSPPGQARGRRSSAGGGGGLLPGITPAAAKRMRPLPSSSSASSNMHHMQQQQHHHQRPAFVGVRRDGPVRVRAAQGDDAAGFRKVWGRDSVRIRTDDGEVVYVRPQEDDGSRPPLDVSTSLSVHASVHAPRVVESPVHMLGNELRKGGSAAAALKKDVALLRKSIEELDLGAEDDGDSVPLPGGLAMAMHQEFMHMQVDDMSIEEEEDEEEVGEEEEQQQEEEEQPNPMAVETEDPLTAVEESLEEVDDDLVLTDHLDLQSVESLPEDEEEAEAEEEQEQEQQEEEPVEDEIPEEPVLEDSLSLEDDAIAAVLSDFAAVRQPSPRASVEQSLDSGALEVILKRVKSLDSNKRKYLLQVLEDLEHEADDSIDPEPPVSEPPRANLLATRRLEDMGTDVLVLRIRSNWGHPGLVGLTEVQLLDAEQRVIRVPKEALGLLTPGVRCDLSFLARVVDGHAKTTSDEHMWLQEYNMKHAATRPLELAINLSLLDRQAKSVRLWNYNRSIQASERGVKDVEILLNGQESVWSGQVAKGCGNVLFDYSTTVSLSAPLPAPPASPPTRVSPPAPSATPSPEPPEPITPDWLSPTKSVPVDKRSLSVDESIDFLAYFSRHHRGRVESSVDLDDSAAGVVKPPSRTLVRRSLSEQIMSHSSATSMVELDSDSSDSDDMLESVERAMAKHTHSAPRLPRPASASMLQDVRRFQAHHRSSSRRLLATPSAKPVPNVFDSASMRRSRSLSMTGGAIMQSTEPVRRSQTMQALPTHQSPEREPDESSVDIPRLPCGKTLELRVLSSWGDPFYVGLAGVEIFDERGQPVQITNPDEQVMAFPDSHETVPGSGFADPRVAKNIVDGTNWTCDELHQWLVPLSEDPDEPPPTVAIAFDRTVTLSMLRIWNYNESRAHASRGVQRAEIRLDGKLIFAGVIGRAPGDIESAVDAAEVILFTDDDEVLDALDAHVPVHPDAISKSAVEVLGDEDEVEFMRKSIHMSLLKREQERPATAGELLDAEEELDDDDQPSLMPQGVVARQAKEVTLCILSTWGDKHFVGMTGLEVLGERGEVIPVDAAHITADPADLNAVPGHSGDDRTVDKLVDGLGRTTDDEHMWLAPLQPPKQTVTITFDEPTLVTGLRVWNYNKSREDSHRGVCKVDVLLDGLTVAPGSAGYFVFPQAPGHDWFDFGHVVWFFGADMQRSVFPHSIPAGVRVPRVKHQAFVPSVLPCGFTLSLEICSTCGDEYYVGLNGMEVISSDGTVLDLERMAYTTAIPESVAQLDGMENDARTVDKLVDGVNDTDDDRHMWLAPFDPVPGQAAVRVFISFHQAVVIGGVRLYNYAKTPERGCRDFRLLLDGNPLFAGALTPAGEVQCIAFSNAPAVLAELPIPNRIVHDNAVRGVRLVNNRSVKKRGGKERAPLDRAGRPKTRAGE